MVTETGLMCGRECHAGSDGMTAGSDEPGVSGVTDDASVNVGPMAENAAPMP